MGKTEEGSSCFCGANCSCGENCQCTETLCHCEALSVLNSLGCSDPTKSTQERQQNHEHSSESALFQPPESSPLSELSQPSSRTVELVVRGMTCSMCTQAIQNTLQVMDGVTGISVSLTTDLATIEYAPDKVSVEALVESVEAIGYDVEDVILEQANNGDAGILLQMTSGQDQRLAGKKRAFVTSLIGTIPIMIITMILPHARGIEALSRWLQTEVLLLGKVRVIREALLLLILATPVQFVSGWSFYRGAWYSFMVTGVLGMDVLVVMGTTASYFYALYECFASSNKEGAHFFETSAVLISFVLLGKWMNALAVRRTSDALTQLMQLQAKVALRVSPKVESCCTSDDFDPTKTAYKEEEVPIELVLPGDLLKIKRGTSIPADGVVTHGEMSVDQSMITGESIPVLKTVGSIVLGGTVCVECQVAFCRVTGVGSSTALSQIVRLVQEAQTRQAPIQNFADTISSVFVPTVATLSVITFLVWYALCNTGVVPPSWYQDMGENDATFSLMFGIACLVISCPCALGLATPTAVMVGTGVGAKRGILVKGGDCLEKASSIDSVVFDKTGTLTSGTPSITDFIRISSLEARGSCCNIDRHKPETHCCSKTPPAKINDVCCGGSNEKDAPSCCASQPLEKQESGAVNRNIHRITNDDAWKDKNYTLWLLGSLERNSEHPLASAVVTYAESQMDAVYLEAHPFSQPTDFRALTGRGASGVINDTVEVAVGNRTFMSAMDLTVPPQAHERMTELEEDGKTAILAAFNGEVKIVIGVADELKPDASSSILYLQNKMNIDVWMVTGDNSRTARAISKRLGLAENRVISEALPASKVRHVRRLQGEGRVVAMIGDGINDSPALAQADVGMSLGTGAEIAAEASDMVLVRGNVTDVCTALDLSRVIFRRIQLNFVWSLVYNCCGIPVAAGVLFPLIHTRLPPTLGAVAMALSSLSVVSSSLALRLYKPPNIDASRQNDSRRSSCCQSSWVSLRERLSFTRMTQHSSSRTETEVEVGEENDLTRRLLDNDHAVLPTAIVSPNADGITDRMEEGEID